MPQGLFKKGNVHEKDLDILSFPENVKVWKCSFPMAGKECPQQIPRQIFGEIRGRRAFARCLAVGWLSQALRRLREEPKPVPSRRPREFPSSAGWVPSLISDP